MAQQPCPAEGETPPAGAYTVYILQCRDGSLYTGITTDLARRLREHNSGRGAKYTRSRGPVTPVYWEVQEDKSAALRREAAIKSLSRQEKLALIQRSPAGARGRFAPSPSGRMHLGNLLAALLAWLDIRSVGGRLVLRMEDLDPARCREEYAAQIARDLEWLGLDWDEGYGAGGPCGPYRQSQRGDIYAHYLRRLEEQELLYPCWCTRAQRLAAQAPHPGQPRGDGACPCRGLTAAQRQQRLARSPAAWRVSPPDEEIAFSDGLQGPYREQLSRDCGDFIVRRADGVCAYQLAVTVDDGLMEINRVVRGRDLLSSTPRQIWLHRVLGFSPPAYWHTPLLLAADGRRLSKRERDMDMGQLRQRFSPAELTGLLAALLGLRPDPAPVTPRELAAQFSWKAVVREDVVLSDRWPERD